MMADKPLFYGACFALVLAAVVVALGAFTRLVDAGLGCPDWPTCYGHLWVPDEHHEIIAANEKYLDTPVETDKTWPEQTHRILASTLGLVILAIFVLALRKNWRSGAGRSVVVLLLVLIAGLIARVAVGQSLDGVVWILFAAYFANLLRLRRIALPSPVPFLLPSAIAGLVILQGFFGMWTVTLKLWPQVVTLHLLGGFATLGLIWLLIQRLGAAPWPALSHRQLRRARYLALSLLVLVVVQIALGGWTSANYAALACPDFPRCQNQWWPHADYGHGFNIFQEVGPNYLGGQLQAEGRTAIHFSHRLGALLVTSLALLLAWRLWSSGHRAARPWAMGLLLVLCAQVSLGISNVVFALPLGVAVIHNGVGALLLLVLIAVNYRLKVLGVEK